MNANIILPTLIAKSAVGIHSICFKTFSPHVLKSGFCLSESKLKKTKRTRKEVDEKPQKTRIALEKNSKNTQIQLHRIELERA